MRIMNINIEGFRGINKKLLLDFNGASTLFFGDNGTGKTSVLQAIEWCIFGKFPYITGEEFRKEDAIVNAFNPEKEASVEVTMKDEKGRVIKIFRKRKMTSSTTRGKAPLNLTIDGAICTKKEAEKRLAQIIGLAAEEYYAVAHLHQEAVRDLVVGKAEDRSKMVDRMLGLYHLRQFVGSLSTRSVENEMKRLEAETKQSGDEKARYESLLTGSREELGRLEKKLSEKGIATAKINIESLAESFKAIQQSLSGVAGDLSAELKPVLTPATLEEAKNKCDELYKVLNDLETQRLGIFGKLKDELSELESLSTNYEKALTAGIKDLKKLTEEKEALAAQISALKDKRGKLLDVNTKLKTEKSIITRLFKDQKEVQEKLSGLQKEYGDPAAIDGKIKDITSKVKETEDMIERQGTFSKLLNLSIQYFEAAKPEECPVCETPIDYANLLSSLKDRTSELKEAKLIQGLRSELNKLSQDKEQLENVLKEIGAVQDGLTRIRSDIEKGKDNIRTLGYKPTEPLLDFIQQQIDILLKEDEKVEKELDELQTQKREIELMEERTAEYTRLEKQIQKILNTETKGDELLKLLNDKIDSVVTETDKIAALDPKFASVRESIDLFGDMLDSIEKKTEIQRVEKTLLPGVESRLKALADKSSKLQELSVALYDIREAATAAQEDFFKRTLASLQEDVNTFYSKLLGHPYYVSMQLVPEKERGKYIYRIRAFDKGLARSTYVQTRFSNAQMNVAAISLFMAMATKTPLGFIVFDDPSQSLDPEHKKALASMIGELAKDMQVFLATQDRDLQEYLLKDMAKIYHFKKWSTEGVAVQLD